MGLCMLHSPRLHWSLMPKRLHKQTYCQGLPIIMLKSHCPEVWYFLVGHDPAQDDVEDKQRFDLCPCDLEHRQLRKISDSLAHGSLSVAADGRGMYAVAYAAAPQKPHEHMFIYSQRLSKAADINQFKQELVIMLPAAGRAFLFNTPHFPVLDGVQS